MENRNYGRIYREMAKVNIKKALAASEFASDLKHPVLNGRIKEIFVTDLLEPYLYPEMGICTGVIIDSKGNQSKQIDIIIYDKKVLPPLMLSATEAAIPAESVLAAIEVKSTLTMTELNKSIENARSVKQLIYDFPDITPHNKLKRHVIVEAMEKCWWQKDELNDEYISLGIIEKPACFVFAFKAGKSTKNTNEEKLIEAMNTAIDNTDKPLIDSLCIAKELTLSFNLGTKEWDSIDGNEDHENIISFLSTVIIRCSKLSQQRIAIPLDKYLT